MAHAQIVMLIPLGEAPGGPPPGIWPTPPGGGAHPSHPIALPPGSISGTPEHPIYTPPAAPGHPSHPIHLPPNSVGGTPEHPIYYPPAPDHGLPGVPPHPDQGLPGQPPGYWGGVAPPQVGNPIAPGGRPPGIWGGAPPYPDQGLPVPPGGLPPLPEVPPELASSIVVAVHKPGQEWEVKTYPVGPDQGLPVPPPA